MDAVSSVDLSETGAWGKLDSLSARTEVDDIEAVPEGIFETGSNRFEAVATVYVDLNYDDNGDGFSTSGNFPAQVQGHFEPSGKAIIDSVSVDTTSFYE